MATWRAALGDGSSPFGDGSSPLGDKPSPFGDKPSPNGDGASPVPNQRRAHQVHFQLDFTPWHTRAARSIPFACTSEPLSTLPPSGLADPMPQTFVLPRARTSFARPPWPGLLRAHAQDRARTLHVLRGRSHASRSVKQRPNCYARRT